jgi:hypothetical protein
VIDGCASRSRACGERPLGSASRARRWILLEQPGPWGADALTSSDLPGPVAARLRRLSRDLPARVLLLRRPGGAVTGTSRRSLFVGRSHAGGGWLEHLELESVHDLLDLDLSPLVADGSVGGQRVTEPRYLVCTNGKHDACCASFGLPVAAALAGLLGDRVWECSHVGGDRFAGNLVCLPDGSFYGHLDPESARRAVAAHEGGRILLDHWRGRSALPFAAQAAEALVRRELALERLSSLRVLRVERLDGSGALHRVELGTADDATVIATVRTGSRPEARALTCNGVPGHAPTFELVSLEREAEPSRSG